MLKKLPHKYIHANSSKLKIFITYSEMDKEFADWLAYKLEQSAMTVFINDYNEAPTDDTEDKENQENNSFEKWQKNIDDMIIKSDTLIYIISPDAMNSENCNNELKFAKSLNKRIIPIVWREPANMKIPEVLVTDQFLHFSKEDEIDDQVKKLVKELQINSVWIRQHTEYMRRAIAWSDARKPRYKLLSNRKRLIAEKWRDNPPEHALPLTPLLGEYIAKSQKAAELPRSIMNALLLMVLAASIVIGGYGWSRTGLAIVNEELAQKNEKRAVDALDAVKLERDTAKQELEKIKQQTAIEVETANNEMQVAKQKAADEIANTKQLTATEIKEIKQTATKEIADAKKEITRQLAILQKDRIKLERQSGEALLTQSRMLTDEAEKLIQQNKPITATLLSIAALQDKNSSDIMQKFRPLYKPALSSLDKAVQKILQKALLKGHQNGVMSVRFSTDGSKLISGAGDNTVRIWDTKNGKLLKTLNGHIASVMSVDISPNNTKIVSGSIDSTIKIWDVKTGKQLRELRGHGGAVTSVQFSPDSNKIVSGSFDTTVRLWDVNTGQNLAVFRGHKRDVMSATFSPDGTKVASGSFDTTVKLWDVATKTEISTLEGHNGWVLNLVFTPDNKKLISASRDQTTIIWDLQTAKPLTSLKGHNGWVMSVAVSPDGKQIVTTSKDKTTKIWDLNTGQELTTRKGHANTVTDVQFSPDGQTMATASEDQTIRIWYAKLGKQLVQQNKQEAGQNNSQKLEPEKLILAAKQRVYRCLTPAERKKFYMSEIPPRWCITGPGNENGKAETWAGKIPYNTQKWQSWLKAKDAGKDIDLPK